MRKGWLHKDRPHRRIEYRGSEATTRTAAALVGMNQRIAKYYFCRLRKLISQPIHNDMPLAWEFEADERYFGIDK